MLVQAYTRMFTVKRVISITIKSAISCAESIAKSATSVMHDVLAVGSMQYSLQNILSTEMYFE